MGEECNPNPTYNQQRWLLRGKERRELPRHLRTYLESCQQIEPIEISLLVRSENQVRSDLGDLTELCASIREHGLLQPIVVRPKGSKFEVICGNRRFEACRRLLRRHIDCIVRELDDKAAFEISLIENVHRSTLSPMEEAKAFRQYVSEFGWGGVSDLARKIGKSEEYVSHRILLLDLPSNILVRLARGEISASQAQELVWFKEKSAREIVVERLEKEKISVAQIRQIRKELETKPVGVDCAPLTTFAQSMPDFKSKGDDEASEKLQKDNGRSRDRKVVEEAILGLRVALIRLDSEISKTQSNEIKEILMKERFELHGQIDRLIRVKTHMPVLQ